MEFNFSDRTVLVTGGNGFLGSHVGDLLKAEKTKKVITFSSKDYNLTVEKDLQNLFQQNRDIDIVIHLAADVGGIGYNSKHPAKQIYNNLMMNTLLQHYAWKTKVKKFVGIGSVCEYPADASIPFKEEDIWNGYPVKKNDAYALSKRMMLAQSVAYKEEYGFNSIHLLPINLYGPRDDFDLENSHVIPALIRKIYEAKKNDIPEVEVWGTGEESREFLFVEDAARAIVLATQKYNDVEPVNIGTGKEVKIKDLARTISRLIQYHGSFYFNDSKPGGHKRRRLDILKAKEYFDFTAQINLEEGLKKTIEYYISSNINN